MKAIINEAQHSEPLGGPRLMRDKRDGQVFLVTKRERLIAVSSAASKGLVDIGEDWSVLASMKHILEPFNGSITLSN